MQMTGAQAMVESLIREGVEVIFGYPGGAILPTYDVLYESPIRHILVRHEQGAAHAADGYARASGKVGVCLATSGPGATNLITGIATAYMDSVPMVAITGQVATGLIGRDAFQEADITGITIPVTKHNYLVKDVRELPRIMKEAFHIARTGRPGPVVVDLPKDVTTELLDYVYPEEEPRLPGYQPTYHGSPLQIQRAAAALRRAQRPLLLAGGGIIASEAAPEIKEIAERLQMPVIATLMALGAFPGQHPLFLGMVGMHGTLAANRAMMNADLVLTVGMRFDDRVTGKLAEFAPHARIIHIDIDPAEIGKNVKVEIPIVGDARLVCRALLAELEKGGSGERGEGTAVEKRNQWVAQVTAWKERHPVQYDGDGARIKPQAVVEAIYRATGGGALVVTGVGQHQMWTAHYYHFARPRAFFTSGGLGTMGYGLPAAVGVQVARPDETVFCIDGDGCFQMTSQELATIMNENLPIKIAIMNNNYLGMVRQWQDLFFSRRYSAVALKGNPDFVKLADAYGVPGIRVEEPDAIQPALEEAMSTRGPFLLDFRVATEENVFPMVPAGAALTEILDGSDQG